MTFVGVEIVVVRVIAGMNDVTQKSDRRNEYE